MDVKDIINEKLLEEELNEFEFYLQNTDSYWLKDEIQYPFLKIQKAGRGFDNDNTVQVLMPREKPLKG